eukprot:jgi/Botrbrau1/5894/Bobra.0366s0072.1
MQPWFTWSPLAFACSDLEALYCAYASKSSNSWATTVTLAILMGWMAFITKWIMADADHRSLLSSLLVPVLGIFIPAVILLVLLLLHPEAYAKYKRFINAATLFGIVLSVNEARKIILWKRLPVKAPSPESWSSWLQYFCDENCFLSYMWMVVVAFPAGVALDICLVTLGVIVELAGNNRICSSPLLGPNPITLGRPILTVTHWASEVVLSMAFPFYPWPAASTSCPAVLGFWQIAGWWLACLAVLATDTATRRAFLRTPAAQALLGPAFGGAALQWPFTTSHVCCKIVRAVYALLLVQSLLWGIVLTVMG